MEAGGNHDCPGRRRHMGNAGSRASSRLECPAPGAPLLRASGQDTAVRTPARHARPAQPSSPSSHHHAGSEVASALLPLSALMADAAQIHPSSPLGPKGRPTAAPPPHPPACLSLPRLINPALAWLSAISCCCEASPSSWPPEPLTPSPTLQTGRGPRKPHCQGNQARRTQTQRGPTTHSTRAGGPGTQGLCSP